MDNGTEQSPKAEELYSSGSKQATNAADGLQPELNHVYFDAVYRHGSIRKAAVALHIASSALNRRILDLEQEVGTPLFERLPRGVRLTEAGELFLTYVRRCAQDLQRLRGQIDKLRGQAGGSVRIGVAESVTPRLLPAAVQTYGQAHPGVSFHITVDGPERLGEALLQDHVDLILTHELLQQPGCMTLAVLRHPLCALVANSHPLALSPSTTLAECSNYPWAIPDRTLAARHLLDVALEHSNLRVTPVIESNSIETLKAFVRGGEAVCFSFHLGQHEETPGLTVLTLRNAHCAEAKLFLATRRGRTLPVAAAAFAEQLKLELEVNLALRLMSPV